MAGQTIGNILVRIGANISSLSKSLNQAERAMMRFSGKMENIGRTLSTTLTLPILGTGVAALKAFGDFEKLEKGMATIMGSAELAGEELKRLQKSAEAPGLGFEQAVAGSIRLQAVGMSADEARETLEQFGNAIATTGGGAEDLDQVTRQLTQMISKNRILQEDFMVLQERMPLVSKAMQGAFGHSNIELIRKSGMGAREFVARLTEEMGKFDRVEGGFSNAFENMMMSAKTAMAQIGEAINKSLDVTGKMEAFAAWIGRAAEWFDNLSDAGKRNILIIAGVVAAIGPLLVGIATMTKVVSAAAIGLQALLSLPGLIIVGLVALATAAVLAYKRFEWFRGGVHALKEGMIEIVKVFGEAVAAFFRGFEELKKGNFGKAGEAFTEALVKANPITMALTQGKRIAGAFSRGYEEGISTEVEAFDPFKDKDKILADSRAVGAEAAAAFGGGFGEAKPIEVKPVSSFEALRRDIPQVQTMLSGVNLEVSKVSDVAMKGASGISVFLEDMSSGIQNFAERFGEVFSMLGGTVDQFFANKASAIDADYQRQRSVIENSTRSEEYKQKALQKLDEETDKKRRKLARAQAIRDKILGIIQATIATARAVAQSLPNIPLSIIAGAIGAAQIALIAGQKIPALAQGGLAYGPSMAVVGDNPGARVDPEVISPLSKLKEMIGGIGGVQRVIVEGRIAGKDILLSSERAQQDRTRTRGF